MADAQGPKGAGSQTNSRSRAYALDRRPRRTADRGDPSMESILGRTQRCAGRPLVARAHVALQRPFQGGSIPVNAMNASNDCQSCYDFDGCHEFDGADHPNTGRGERWTANVRVNGRVSS
eukprot:53808-Chlamydomonas_euryale.AAC.2